MDERLQVCLNGLWDFCPGDGTLDRWPDAWEETPIQVPSPWNINAFAGPQSVRYGEETLFLKGGEYNLYPEYPAAWEAVKSGWYQRELLIPEEWRGKVITLRFNAVLFYSEFYMNGHLVSTDRDGFLPHEFPIQDCVRYGERNVLTVGVKMLETFRYRDEAGKNKIEYPTGSFWGMSMGGIWQDVFLRVYPREHIRDIFVKTDVKSCSLSVEGSLALESGSGHVLRIVLQEWRGETCHLLAEALPVEGDRFDFAFDYSAIGNGIKLWWPDTPALYQLVLTLVKDGTVLDSRTERFGFRSFEAVGRQFHLNGVPYNLRNDSWHYMGFAYQNEEYAKLWYKMAKAANVNCIRLHAQVYPEFFLDIADEMGMLIVDETSIWASHCQFHYSQQFAENGKNHVRRLIERDRNHPSVIIWSVENECIMAYRVSADDGVRDEKELNERLYQLAEQAAVLDPTRLVSGDGSQDMGGRLGIYSLHYPGRTCPEEVDKPITIGEMGSLYYATPDCVCNHYGEKTYLSFEGRLEAIGRELFESLKHQRKWAAQVCVFNLVWYGLQPLPFRERIVEYGDLSLPGVKPTKIGPYLSTLNAGYDESLPEYIPNQVFDWVRRAYLPERFFFESGKSRYYNGETGQKTLSVFNDTLQVREYEIEWHVDYDGGRLPGGCKKLRIQPATYEWVEIGFALPYSRAIEKCRLSVGMKGNGQVVFEDDTGLKIYNKEYLFEKINRLGKIGLIGRLEDGKREFFRGLDIQTDLAGYTEGISHYLLGEGATEETAAGLSGADCHVLDLLPGEHGLRMSMLHGTVEKAFVNVADAVLREELEEEDLDCWGQGILTDSAFRVVLCTNAVNLLSTGKGLPLVLDYTREQGHYVACSIPLLQCLQQEPAALALLAALVAYMAARKPAVCGGCVLVSQQGSDLHRFFQKKGVDFTLVDPADRKQLRGLRDVRIIVADGSYPLEYVHEMMPYNVERMILWNVKEATLPDFLKAYVEIVGKPLYHLVKGEEENELIRGIHGGGLYGLEAGEEAMLCEQPLRIKDGDRVKGILKSPDLDWRMWNYQGEDRKIISILRSGKERKQDLYALAKTSVNTVEVVVCQIGVSHTSSKLQKLACDILSNAGIALHSREGDAFDQLIREGIYTDRVVKALVLQSGTDLPGAGLEPGINHAEGGAFWRISSLSEERKGRKTPFCYYALNVHSPSDRTDLLLNPDLMGVHISNENEKELYLNDTWIAGGKEISLPALQLRKGWNKLIVKETRENQAASPARIGFKRKDNDSLDLQFSLEPAGLTEISGEQWEFTSNYNARDCGYMRKGKGYFWSSLDTQQKGMVVQVDMKEVREIAKIQFNARMEDDSVRLNTPRSFVLLSSLDGEEWSEFYQAPDEENLSFPDGKVILWLAAQKARYLRLMITNVALKPLAVSEFRLFAAGTDAG